MGGQKCSKVLCMGSIVMDHVMYMDKLPNTGESIMTDNFYRFPGGKGSNQAVTASRLGAHVQFFGRLGDESTSDEMMRIMKAENIDMSRIIITHGTTAGIAMIMVDREGRNYVTFDPAATLLLTDRDVYDNADTFTKGDLFLLTMEFHRETTYAAIKTAKKNGMTVVLDPLPVDGSSIPSDIPPLVDIIKPNETEAAALTGVKITDLNSAKQAVFKLRELGFHTPAITLGSNGILTYIDGEFVHIPPCKVNAVDSTAAGDVFLGAFAASLSQGNEIVDALRFANVAAALSTTRKGAQTSIPVLDEVLKYVQENA